MRSPDDVALERLALGMAFIVPERVCVPKTFSELMIRIGGAKFPVLKDIDTFTFADTPIDEGQVRELATGTFLDAKRNAIFIGGTGTGKTHLCIAVASAVIRNRARGRFFNLVDLVNQLEQEKAAGRG